MKKRGNRDIPDFSRKIKGPPRADRTDAKPQEHGAPPPSPTRAIKPHSTSQKSGRRGS
jgi:hypothetical protein